MVALARLLHLHAQYLVWKDWDGQVFGSSDISHYLPIISPCDCYNMEASGSLDLLQVTSGLPWQERKGEAAEALMT